MLVGLKSLFQKHADTNIRCDYRYVDMKDILHFKRVSVNPVEKIYEQQVNIGFYHGTYWFVFHTVTRYIIAQNNFTAQLYQVINS